MQVEQTSKRLTAKALLATITKATTVYLHATPSDCGCGATPPTQTDAWTSRTLSARSKGPASCDRSDESRPVCRGTATCATRPTVFFCSDLRNSQQTESQTARPSAAFAFALGLHKPSQVGRPLRGRHSPCHEGSPRRLPERLGRRRSPTEHLESRVHPGPPLPVSAHPMEVPSGWTIRHDQCFVGGSRLSVRGPPVPCPRSPSLLPHYHARMMPPDSLLLGAKKMQTSIIRCLGGILHVQIFDTTWLRAQVSIEKVGLDIRDHILRSPAATMASNSRTEALCNSLWDSYDALLTWKSMRAVAWLTKKPHLFLFSIGMPTLSERLYNTASASRFSAKIPSSPPCVAKSPSASATSQLSSHAQGSQCRNTAVAHAFYDVAQEAVLHSQKERQAFSSAPAPTVPPCGSLTERIQRGKPGILRSPPATAQLPETLIRWVAHTQNLTEHETLERSSTTRPPDAIETSSVSHQRFSTATPEGGATLHVHWPLGIANVSAPPLFAQRATSISTWLHASLRHFTVTQRAVSRPVRLVASRDSPPSLVASFGRPVADDWAESWPDSRRCEADATTTLGPDQVQRQLFVGSRPFPVTHALTLSASSLFSGSFSCFVGHTGRLAGSLADSTSSRIISLARTFPLFSLRSSFVWHPCTAVFGLFVRGVTCQLPVLLAPVRRALVCPAFLPSCREVGGGFR